MNKLLTKIVGAALGATLAIGVGVAVASQNNEAKPVHAATSANWTVHTGDLVAGTEYLIVKLDGTKCMAPTGSANTSSNPYSQVNFNLTTAPENGFIFEDSGNSDGTFKIKDTTGATAVYVYSTNDNNGLRCSASPSNGNIWTADEESSGVYRLHNNLSDSRQISAYSSSDWRPYKSNSGNKTNVKIYEKVTVSDVTATYVSAHGTLSKSSDTVTAGSSVTLPTISNKPSNYSFEGFSDGTSNYAEGASVVINADTTFTAQWTEIKELSNITLSGQTTTFDVGDEFEFGGTVTAHYEDSTSANVTSKATFSGYNMSSAGTQEVTVSYTEGQITKTATYNITVNAVTSVEFVAGTDLGSTSASGSADEVAKKGITMSCTNAAFATAEYRFYSGSALTISSTIGNIGSIQFTKNGSYAYSLISVDDDNGTYNESTGLWEGDSASVSFSLSAQFRADSVKVDLVSTAPSLKVNPSEVELKTNEPDGAQVVATVKNVDNPTFTWTPSVANIVTIEVVSTVNKVQTVAIKPNTDSAVDLTVTLTVGGASPALSPVDISVSITVPGPGESQGTAFTVAQAIAHINSVISGGESTGNDGNYYYARGIVSSIYSSSVNNGQISYYISDDGTTTTQLEAYNGKGLNGESFTSIDDIEIGDTVIIYGKLKKYSSTYEFDSNNHLVSQTKAPKVNSITLDPSIVTVAPDDAGDIVDLFTNITINQDTGSSKTVNDIVWTTADDAVFYIDGTEYLVAGAHKTSTAITATIGSISTTATINVVDPNHPFISYDSLTEWDLVSDPSTLVAGDRVILTGVKNDVTYAAGTYSGSGNNVPSDTTNTLTVSGTKVTAGVVSTMIYTLEEGTETGSVAFKDSTGKYLYAAGGTSSNYMKSQSSIDGNASFILNSDRTVVAQGTSTHNYMRYNNTSSSNLFSCYGSSSTTGDLVTFYKMAAGTVDLDDTILTLVRSKMSTYKDEHNVDQYGLSICNYNGGSDLSTWNSTVANGFTASIISTYHLADARANRAGNDVEKFLSAYDYVVENYGASYDFLGRIASGKVTPVQQSRIVLEGLMSQNAATPVIVIISLISLTTIGGYFFLRKKKEQ